MTRIYILYCTINDKKKRDKKKVAHHISEMSYTYVHVHYRNIDIALKHRGGKTWKTIKGLRGFDFVNEI